MVIAISSGEINGVRIGFMVFSIKSIKGILNNTSKCFIE
jgi:hypothetical protein